MQGMYRFGSLAQRSSRRNIYGRRFRLPFTRNLCQTAGQPGGLREHRVQACPSASFPKLPPWSLLARNAGPARAHVAGFAGRVAEGGEIRCAARAPPGVERPAHGGEGELAPGNLPPAHQAHSGAFRAGRNRRRGEARAENQLHLREARDGKDGEQPVDLDGRARLLDRLALRPVLRRLMQLQIARRQGPEALARLDGPPAEQQPAAERGNRAHHDLRVLIGDMPAIGADQPLPVIALGHGADERAGAHRARAWPGRPPLSRPATEPRVCLAAPPLPPASVRGRAGPRMPRPR